MGHQQLAPHQPNIGLDRTKPLIQRIEQRTRVLVIVMSMRPLPNRRRLAGHGPADHQKQSDQNTGRHNIP